MRSAVIAVMAVFTVIIASAAVIFTDDSRAETDYGTYHGDQLDSVERAIYDALAAKASASASGAAGAYYYEVAIDICDLAFSGDTAKADAYFGAELKAYAEKAFAALRLDNPYAVCTWTNAADPVSVTFTKSSTSTPYYVTAFSVRVAISDDYGADAVSRLNDAKAVVDDIHADGSNMAEKVRSVNSKLRGDYGYVIDTKDNPYAGTVCGVKTEGKKLTPEGFAMVFKQVCKNNGIPCVTVEGYYADGKDGMVSAWNLVVDDKCVYGVDTGINARDSSDDWMMAGLYTQHDGVYFNNLHRANYGGVAVFDYSAVPLSTYGYEWPADNSITAVLMQYAPWIITGVVCIILAVVLVLIARKGDN